MADVGGISAASHAARMDCGVCGCECEPEIIERETRSGDYFERLRCRYPALLPGEPTTFRRIWIGGYR